MARRPLSVEHDKLVHTQADLRDVAAREAVAGVDVLWHLGFQLWRTGGRNRLDGINVPGTRNLVDGAPGRIVFASSASVYGAWPDNPLPMSESHAARPNAECTYAEDKLEAEKICLDSAPTAVLRIAAVLGPNVDPQVRKAVKRYKLSVPAVRGATQALQFVDEDEVAAAFVLAGKSDGTGVFNIATEDWLSESDIAGVAGSRVLRLPLGMTLKSSEALARLRFLPFGADRACLLNGPLALDCSAAADSLGWRPTRTSAEVLTEAIRA